MKFALIKWNLLLTESNKKQIRVKVANLVRESWESFDSLISAPFSYPARSTVDPESIIK